MATNIRNPSLASSRDTKNLKAACKQAIEDFPIESEGMTDEDLYQQICKEAAGGTGTMTSNGVKRRIPLLKNADVIKMYRAKCLGYDDTPGDPSMTYSTAENPATGDGNLVLDDDDDAKRKRARLLDGDDSESNSEDEANIMRSLARIASVQREKKLIAPPTEGNEYALIVACAEQGMDYATIKARTPWNNISVMAMIKEVKTAVRGESQYELKEITATSRAWWIAKGMMMGADFPDTITTYGEANAHFKPYNMGVHPSLGQPATDDQVTILLSKYDHEKFENDHTLVEAFKEKTREDAYRTLLKRDSLPSRDLWQFLNRLLDQARVPDSKKPAFHKKAKKSSADCQAVINDVKSMAKKKKATYVHH